MNLRALTAAVSAVAFVGLTATAAQTITWTGLGDGESFGDLDNWTARPWGHAWIARFTNSVTVVLNKNLTYDNAGTDATALIGGYQVEAGDVYITKEQSGFATGVNGSHAFVDVAEGSKLVCSNNFSYYNPGTFHKRGKGLWQMAGATLGGEDVWRLDFEAGKTEFLGGKCSSTCGVVRAGAELALMSAVADDRLVLEVEKDAVLRVSGNKANLANLQGEGSVVGEPYTPYSRLFLTLKRAAWKPFTGTFSGGLALNVDTPAAGVDYFVPTRADMLADAGVSKGDGLRYLPLPAVNEVGLLSGFYSGYMYLNDADGNPVTVRAKLGNTGTMWFRGTGNLWVKNQGTVLLYQSFYSATGFIGACTGATLQLGNGSTSAYDFDYSGAGIKGVYCEDGAGLSLASAGGANREVNVPVVGLGKGAIEFTGSYPLTFHDLHFTATNKVATSSGIDFRGGEMVFTRFVGSGGTKTPSRYRLISGARVHAPKVKVANDALSILPQPAGIACYGDNGWYVTQITAGEFWRGAEGGGHKEHHMFGGTTYFTDGAAMSTTDKALADGGNAKLLFDGGTAVWLNRSDTEQTYFPTSSADSHIDLFVSTNGGTIVVKNAAEASERYYTFMRPFVATNGVDGGISFFGSGIYGFTSPMQLQGPVRLMDGQTRVMAGLYTDNVAAPFGSGDLVMRNARLAIYDNVTDRRTLRLATGTDAALVLAGTAAISPRWNSTASVQDISIGRIRREKGGILFVRTCGSDVLGAADGSSIKVTDGLALQASGLTKVPVIVGGATTDAFATYDATAGLKPFTAFATDFAQGADSVVSMTADTTISADCHVGGVQFTKTWGILTINAGKTLTVGNGTDPATIILGVVGDIRGTGTLDFGGSEGILVANNSSGTHPNDIYVKISGSNGLSLVNSAVNDQGYKIQLHNGANDYTGGTVINTVNVWANHATCFSSGPVTVGGGTYSGGSVFFQKAGPFANDFRIAGTGSYRTNYRGALCFKVSGEVSGDVEIYEDARVTAADGCRGTLSGVVSGRKLQIRNNIGSPRDNGGTVVLAGHNTYTGGTEVVAAGVAVKEADGFGSGPVTIDGSTLEFVNTAPIALANRFEGIGRVKLSGTGKVTMTGDHTDFTAPLDLFGENLTLAEMPNFVTGLTNSVNARCTLTVPAGAALDLTGFTAGGLDRVDLVLEAGAALDLGGKTLTIRRLTGNRDAITGGELVELKPRQGLILVVR